MACVLVAGGAGCGADVGPIEGLEPIGDAAPFQFPLELWDQGVEGETILRIHVDEAGVVDSVVIDESSGYPAFDEAAKAGAYELRFDPARRGGETVATWAKLPVRFSRDTARFQATPIQGPP